MRTVKVVVIGSSPFTPTSLILKENKMNLPDVKSEAHKNIDKCSDGIVGMIQIIADVEGQVSTCIAGIPEVIVHTLANVMRDHDQLRDLITAAWLNSGKTEN